MEGFLRAFSSSSRHRRCQIGRLAGFELQVYGSYLFHRRCQIGRLAGFEPQVYGSIYSIGDAKLVGWQDLNPKCMDLSIPKMSLYLES
jgi:hypothetical protein